MTFTVHDVPDRSRYEIRDGDRPAGFSDYRLADGRIAFTHTEIRPEFGGRGLGSRLVAAQLDDARRRGLAVLPLCPFVRRFVERHAESYLDLVPDEDRERFDLPSDDR